MMQQNFEIIFFLCSSKLLCVTPQNSLNWTRGTISPPRIAELVKKFVKMNPPWTRTHFMMLKMRKLDISKLPREPKQL